MPFPLLAWQLLGRGRGPPCHDSCRFPLQNKTCHPGWMRSLSLTGQVQHTFYSFPNCWKPDGAPLPCMGQKKKKDWGNPSLVRCLDDLSSIQLLEGRKKELCLRACNICCLPPHHTSLHTFLPTDCLWEQWNDSVCGKRKEKSTHTRYTLPTCTPPHCSHLSLGHYLDPKPCFLPPSPRLSRQFLT